VPGLIERNPEKLLVAVELARSSERTLEHAGSCEDAADVLATGGDYAQGRALLEQALALYESIGASWCTPRASARPRQIGRRRGSRGSRQRALTGWESLTRSERVVAELVAEGLTNREVASACSSRHTP
jgi:DNA-binding NarL/FixJ family response regulator